MIPRLITVLVDGVFRRGGTFYYAPHSQHCWYTGVLYRSIRTGVLRSNDEGITWLRGWHFRWWPPHRRQMNACMTAAALARLVEPPHEPHTFDLTGVRAIINAQQISVRMHEIRDAMMCDMNKLTADATKSLSTTFRYPR